MPEYESGHRPPAPSLPSPPRGQPGHECEPTAGFCVIGGRAQSGHPGAAAVGDLHPDSPGAGRHGDRDRLAGQSRVAVPHAVDEKLAHQQDSVIPAREGGDDAPRPRTCGRPAPAPCARRPARFPGPPGSSAHRLPARTENWEGRERAHGKYTLTSAAIVKPNPNRERASRTKAARYARLLPVKIRTSRAGSRTRPETLPGRRIR